MGCMQLINTELFFETTQWKFTMAINVYLLHGNPLSIRA